MESKEIQLSTELDIPPEELEIVPIHSLCRLCATQNERLIGLYSEEGVTNDLANKINLYLPVKVSIGDELPLQCCWSCASTILAWHELVLASVEADRKFRSLRLPPAADIIDHGGFEAVPSVPTDDDMTFDIVKLEDSDCEDKKILKHETSEVDLIYKRFRKIKPAPSTRLNESEEETLILVLEPSRKQKPTPPTQQFDEIADLTTNTCTSCPITFPDSTLLKKHVKEAHNVQQKRHRRRPDEIVPQFFCDMCQKGYTRKNDVKKHKIQSHGAASLDNETVTSKKNVPREFFCDLCECGFTRKNDMNRHKRYAHGIATLDGRSVAREKKVEFLNGCICTDSNGKILYRCNVCEKTFAESHALMLHSSIHTGVRAYCCHICGQSFRLSSTLSRHIKSLHDKIKRYSCEICKKWFTSKANQNEHMNIHTDTRPYVCDVCGKAFKQMASLRTHKIFHENVFKFQCSSCGKRFRTSQQFKHHQWLHTGYKPKSCPQCKATFRLGYALKRHLMVHKNDGHKYVCSECGSVFSQERYRKAHMKRHKSTTTTITAEEDS